VTDVDRSATWWEQVMGFSRIYAFRQETFHGCNLIHLSGFVVSVMTHSETVKERFDERRVGLDHFSFQVTDRSALDAWVAHLNLLKVNHTGVIESHFGDTVVIRDPDGIQLELFVHPDPERIAQLMETDPNADA
jgi:glyoxylase I family protein